ncbi:hypothetical protein TCON_0604 [Astathelohania contejeani]|uniref:Uncharacterized protein n=1 Tax=Astathelohania contejeani TaxID=164912 RepID=A0ABQ7I1A2_9MICR|nr:hypothetical protein TCON_0604 [Thelohania contejeani]
MAIESYRCMEKGVVILPFKVHIDEMALTQISNLDLEPGDKFDKANRFFKSIFGPLNNILSKSGVHVQFRIENEILKSDSYCVEISPVLAKAKALANKIKDNNSSPLGNRILIVSCPLVYLNMHDTLEVNECENVSGFMFDSNTLVFKQRIINEILRMISKSPRIDGFETSEAFKTGICKYINSCVAHGTSSVGVYREDW